MTDPRWPGLMKPATARRYLDMGAAKFRDQVAPLLTPRTVGARLYYRRTDLDRFGAGELDAAGRSGNRRSPSEWLEAVDHDLAQSPRRKPRHG